ncbi:MAG TPA: hypothetical protein VF627_01965 [Abditibacterium sp.]
MKASTLCAGSAFLVLGGFMSVNLAGCGGGGGGGGSVIRPTATPASQAITFNLQLQDGTASSGGTVSLVGPVALSAEANESGVATIPAVPPGNYAVTFTVNNADGSPGSTTTQQITITRAAGQVFLLLQDGISNGGTLRVTGTVRLNPTDDDPDNNPATPNCGTSTEQVTGPFLVSAIDLSSASGQAIIAQVRRSPQSTGAYTILLPKPADTSRPLTFRIRIGQYDASGARFAGESASTNITNGTSVDRVDVCANQDGTIPNPNVTATPFVTLAPTATTGPTITTAPTITPTPPPTATPTATTSGTPSATATGTPTSGIATPTPTP